MKNYEIVWKFMKLHSIILCFHSVLMYSVDFCFQKLTAKFWSLLYWCEISDLAIEKVKKVNIAVMYCRPFILRARAISLGLPFTWLDWPIVSMISVLSGFCAQRSVQGWQPSGIPEHWPPKAGGKQEPLTDPLMASLVRIWKTTRWVFRGRIFSCVWPFYERAVSNLDP